MALISDIWEANAAEFLGDLRGRAERMRGVVERTTESGDYRETCEAYQRVVEAALKAAEAAVEEEEGVEDAG